MFKNYFKTALRSAYRYKAYTALNLLGLIVGAASSMLIWLWVRDEVMVDRFHKKGDEIYQLFRNMKQSDGVFNTTFTVPKPMADLMRSSYSEVDKVAQYSWPVDILIGEGDDFSSEEGRFVSPEFLDLFTFPLIIGSKASALSGLDNIVISKSLARKKFGESWHDVAQGSRLRINEERDAIIAGVFEDPGTDSSLDFDWLMPAQRFFNENDWVEDWGNGNFNIFFTLKDKTSAPAVASRITGEIIRHTRDNDKAGEEYLIMVPFADRYLHSNFNNGVVDGGRIDYVRIMSVVAVFLLLVASVNFMNLATARSGRRSKEIGLRKTLGAGRNAIRTQFFVESFMNSVVAVMLSLALVAVLLPYFNHLTDKDLSIDFEQFSTLVFLPVLILFLGILSGSYPAFVLSRLPINRALKGIANPSSATAYLRKGLVVFQFTVSTLLLIGTAVIYDQISFMLNKDLGLDKDNLLMVPMKGDLSERQETYRAELAAVPQVKSMTVVSGNPVAYGRSTSSASWRGKPADQGYEINVMLTDEHFISTMGMEMAKGRMFSNQVNDSTNFLINEVAASLMGFENPIGESLRFWGLEGKIIGVVKNFHMQNFYEPIAPLIITCVDPTRTYYAILKIEGSVSDALPAVQGITEQLNPNYEFDYEFLDQSYARSYQNELTVRSLAAIFSAISIFISCLGLFGLSSYTTEQRAGEIGIRKVYGAGTSQILYLLTKDYSVLILMAFALAVPVGYYYARDWLEGFQFKTDLKPWIFLVAGAVSFLVGILAVAGRSYKAASVNPVESLRAD